MQQTERQALTESQEFRSWLRRHNNRLRSYTPDQLALMARLCGFPLELVCHHVPDWVMHIKRLFNFWESPFLDQWLNVAAYEKGRLHED